MHDNIWYEWTVELETSLEKYQEGYIIMQWSSAQRSDRSAMVAKDSFNSNHCDGSFGWRLVYIRVGMEQLFPMAERCHLNRDEA